MKDNEIIPAVAYGRMSTDDQELSPEQQRREVEEYARRNGYEILRWYFDEGKSASKGDELRTDYQKLLIDSNSRNFKAVLCWATSRFTRNHPHEAADGKRILRTNGVHLDTVKEGKIDWNSFEGLIKDSIYNLIDHTYSVGLGRDSLRGRRNTFLAGGYPYGSIPYGYDHLYVSGAEQRRVRRGTKTKNLRGWIQSLALVEDEAQVVRRIFDLFVNHDKSLMAVARLLNRENVAGPGKGVNAVWTTQNVRTRLRCGAYAGLSTIGGKEPGYRKAHNRLELEERQGIWTPIVDRDLWDAAQAKLDGHPGQGQAHDGKSGPLQGILRCGVCGKVLHKENPRRADDPRGNQYRCASPAKGLPTDCKRWTCYESEVMPVIVREVVKAVDEETIRLLEALPEMPGKITNREVLQAHLTSLEGRISEAAGAYLDPKISPTMKKAIEAKVNELDAEAVTTRQRLQAIAVAQNQGGFEVFMDWWRKVRPELVWIGGAGVEEPKPVYAMAAEGDIIDTQTGKTHPGGNWIAAGTDVVPADPGKLRAMLKRLGVSVRVYWRQPTPEEREARKKGRGHGCPGRLPEWVIDQARLNVEIDCGSSESRNASVNSRAIWRRAGTRRRASRGP